MKLNEIKTYTLITTLAPGLISCLLIACFVIFNQIALLKKQTMSEGIASLERFIPAIYQVLDNRQPNNLQENHTSAPFTQKDLQEQETPDLTHQLQKIISRILEEKNVRAVTLLTQNNKVHVHVGPNMYIRKKTVFSAKNDVDQKFFSIVETASSSRFLYKIRKEHQYVEDLPLVQEIEDTFSISEKFLYWLILPSEVEIQNIIKKNNLTTEVPYQKNQSVLGSIEIEITHIQRNIELFKLALSFLILLLLSLISGYILSSQLIKKLIIPIEKIGNIAEQVRLGHFDVRIAMFGFIEFREVFSKINTMVHYINTTYRQMQMDVDQSTQDLRETLETIEVQNIELNLAKKEALKASKIKSAFLANMSHEIRTPLNGIIGFSKILRNTELTSRQLDYVETIYKSSQNLLAIINDILDFSKMEAG